MKILSIMLGGALGSVSRYYLGNFIQKYLTLAVLPGTFFVNILGCALIGFLYGVGDQKGLLNHNTLLFFSVGFCGAFTTFATFILETHQLTQTNLWQPLFYIALSVIVGFVAFYAANLVAHHLF